MHKRKKFAEFVNLNDYHQIQEHLDNQSKMKIMICENEGKPVSGLMWSAIGDTGIPIFSATGDQGLKLNSSYLLRWKLIMDLKNSGCRFLDQGGINPKLNPGGYYFKRNMGGEDIHLFGQYIISPNKLYTLLFQFAIFLNANRKTLKRYIYIGKKQFIKMFSNA